MLAHLHPAIKINPFALSRDIHTGHTLLHAEAGEEQGQLSVGAYESLHKPHKYQSQSDRDSLLNIHPNTDQIRGIVQTSGAKAMTTNISQGLIIKEKRKNQPTKTTTGSAAEWLSALTQDILDITVPMKSFVNFLKINKPQNIQK